MNQFGLIEKTRLHPRFKTGIPEIDEQHTELFRRIDSLSPAIYAGKGRNSIQSLMRFLERYVFEHFGLEEEMMGLHNYPRLSNHKKLHEGFIQVYKEFSREFVLRGTDNYLAIHLEKEIWRWWEEHVLREDMQYIPYFKAGRN